MRLPRSGLAALRFLAAAALLSAAVYICHRSVYGLAACIARDAIALATPGGLVSGAAWSPETGRFALESSSLGLTVLARSNSLPFLLVVPSALAWALSMRRRPLVAAALCAAGLVGGALILGQDLLALLDRDLEARGISVFSPARSAFHRAWLRLGWDLAMVVVPAAACVLVIAPRLVTQTNGTRAEPPARPALRRIRMRRQGVAAGLAFAAAVAGVDTLLAARLADASLHRRFLVELEAREPDLPDYLVDAGHASFAAGRSRDAVLYFERARLFPASRVRADQGLALVRSVTDASRNWRRAP